MHFSFYLFIFFLFLNYCLCGCPFSKKSDNNESLINLLHDYFIYELDETIIKEELDPLQAMNLLLQENYASTKRQLLSLDLKKYPLIIIDGDYLLYFHNGNYQNYSIVPDLFTNEKLVSHVALGTYVLLADVLANNGSVTSSSSNAIHEYLAIFPDAYNSLYTRNFTQEQLSRAQYIMNSSEIMLQNTLNTGHISSEDVFNYARPLTLPLTKNIKDAALAQLTLVNDIVQGIKKELTIEEWEAMYVVILGSHMARHGESLAQYFSDQLNTNEISGKRIVYAEGLQLPEGLDLLSTHLIDFSVGEAFWAKGEHMHWDILAPASHKIIPWLDEINESK